VHGNRKRGALFRGKRLYVLDRGKTGNEQKKPLFFREVRKIHTWRNVMDFSKWGVKFYLPKERKN